MYRPQQTAAVPSVQLKPANNFRTEIRPAPPVYRPAQSRIPSVQLRPVNCFRTETRPAPPAYRSHRGGDPQVQLKPANNSRLETRSAPVYRPQQIDYPNAQPKSTNSFSLDTRPALPMPHSRDHETQVSVHRPQVTVPAQRSIATGISRHINGSTTLDHKRPGIVPAFLPPPKAVVQRACLLSCFSSWCKPAEEEEPLIKRRLRRRQRRLTRSWNNSPGGSTLESGKSLPALAAWTTGW